MNRRGSSKKELPKWGEKPTTYRRVVTENANGKSVIQSDELLTTYEFKTVPGYEHTLIWVNTAVPDLTKEQRFDRYPDSVVPGPGGTSLHFVKFPPGSVFADPAFDVDAAREEALVRLRGLADHFEKKIPQCTGLTPLTTLSCTTAKSGLSLMTPELFISGAATPSCKTVRAMRGEIKAQSRSRCCFF